MIKINSSLKYFAKNNDSLIISPKRGNPSFRAIKTISDLKIT